MNLRWKITSAVYAEYSITVNGTPRASCISDKKNNWLESENTSFTFCVITQKATGALSKTTSADHNVLIRLSLSQVRPNNSSFFSKMPGILS